MLLHKFNVAAFFICSKYFHIIKPQRLSNKVFLQRTIIYNYGSDLISQYFNFCEFSN